MSLLIRTVALVVVLAPATSAVLAQPAAASASRPASAASGFASAPMGYRSVFEGYRGFSEQPVVSWREANDLVGRIGGWQAYAREGMGGAEGVSDAGNSPAPASTAPATKAPAAPAAASAPQSGSHSGHKMP